MEYGLIGEKLGHSFSKAIHEMIADYTYELKEIKKEDFDKFMIDRDFKCINVTIPYKKDVIPYLDFISEEAKKIGAVNTIINKDGKLYGYNTDYYGLKLLIQKQNIELTDKNVLVLGIDLDSNSLQPENALSPIVVIPFSITIDLIK